MTVRRMERDEKYPDWIVVMADGIPVELTDAEWAEWDACRARLAELDAIIEAKVEAAEAAENERRHYAAWRAARRLEIRT